ncbi:MAG: hypothetical protein RML56_02780 [Burkholderiales bacterium]|nr:hypothetical protein [Burkholderiales bacterium]
MKVGKPKDPEAAKQGTQARERGANFECLMSGAPITDDYINAQKARPGGWARG